MSRRWLLIFALLITAPAAAPPVAPPLTQPAATLLPVPSAVAQSAARDMIHKLYKTDFDKKSPADRQALAKLLVAQAKDTKDDSAARYIALMEAADLAAGAGDASTAFAALEQI